MNAKYNFEPVRIFADWQVWGDGNAEVLVTEYLSDAADRDQIDAFKILVHSDGGPFGLQYVCFTVDTNFNFNQMMKPKKASRKILNAIVHDTDVSIRWIKALKY